MSAHVIPVILTKKEQIDPRPEEEAAQGKRREKISQKRLKKQKLIIWEQI